MVLFVWDNMIEKEIKKQQIKIFLLKNGIKNSEILRDDFAHLEEKKGDGFVFFDFEENYNFSQKDLFSLFRENLRRTVNISSHKMIIIKEININNEKMSYLICLGDVRSMLNAELCVSDFGFIAGINFLVHHQGEILTKDITSKNTTNGDLNRQAKVSSRTFHTFQFREQIDRLKEMKVLRKNGEKYITWTLSNSVAFPFDTVTTKEILFELTDEIVKNYKNNSYIDAGYEFIRNYQLVEKELEETLFDKVVSEIEENIFLGVIAWPDFESDLHEFYKVGKNAIHFFSLEDKEVLNAIKAEKASILNVEIHSANASGNLISKRLKNLLVCEIEHDGHKYALSDGSWVKIDSNFLERINNFYSQIKPWEFEMPVWTNEQNECAYNKQFTEKIGGFLLDRKLIGLGERYSKIEVADLALFNETNKKLIAVKNGSISAGVSHLIAQVKNSIQAIMNSASEINEKIREHVNEEFDVSKIDSFVIAIGSKKQESNGLPKLPFFAKLSICELLNQNNGFKINIVWIKME